jgi:succinate dehydrogenase (ubiquinone) cytochrome b560 subunit
MALALLSKNAAWYPSISRMHVGALSLQQNALKTSGAAQAQMDKYWKKQKTRNRPMSPHLTIYAPQLTSILSISHRITGMAVTGAFVGLAWGSLMYTAADVQQFADAMNASTLGSLTLLAAKFSLAFPIVYHSCNGIRHLLWDNAQYLTTKGVYQTGYIMLAISATISLLLVMLMQQSKS